MRTLQELETLFRKIGAGDPEGWAKDEFETGSRHLASLAFLRELRSLVPAPEDKGWLRRWVAYEADAQPDACAGYHRLIDAGSNSEDLLLLVRGVLSELVMGVIGVLDEGQPRDLEDEVAEKMRWRLCALTEQDRLVPLNGLHEFDED